MVVQDITSAVTSIWNIHINRHVKVAIDGLGANKSKKAIGRVAKAMGVLSETTKSFDSKVGITAPSGKHSDPKTAKDLSV